ncbi:hypothetical protein ACJBPX_10570, partial [Streptococcus suis]
SYSWTDVEYYSDSEKFMLEQEFLGVGISPHPLVNICRESKRIFTDLADLAIGNRATVLVQIQAILLIRTKKTGEQMAFLRVKDTKRK